MGQADLLHPVERVVGDELVGSNPFKDLVLGGCEPDCGGGGEPVKIQEQAWVLVSDRGLGKTNLPPVGVRLGPERSAPSLVQGAQRAVPLPAPRPESLMVALRETDIQMA